MLLLCTAVDSSKRDGPARNAQALDPARLKPLGQDTWCSEAPVRTMAIRYGQKTRILLRTNSTLCRSSSIPLSPSSILIQAQRDSLRSIANIAS